MVVNDMCRKALHGGVDIWDYVKTYTFNNFDFLTFSGIFSITISFQSLLVYIYLSALLPLFLIDYHYYHYY